jgi:hypothetical protein
MMQIQPDNRTSNSRAALLFDRVQRQRSTSHHGTTSMSRPMKGHLDLVAIGGFACACLALTSPTPHRSPHLHPVGIPRWGKNRRRNCSCNQQAVARRNGGRRRVALVGGALCRPPPPDVQGGKLPFPLLPS